MKTFENYYIVEAFAMLLILLGALGLVAGVEERSTIFIMVGIIEFLIGGFVGFYPYMEF